MFQVAVSEQAVTLAIRKGGCAWADATRLGDDFKRKIDYLCTHVGEIVAI
jgi:hypothetical protein